MSYKACTPPYKLYVSRTKHKQKSIKNDSKRLRFTPKHAMGTTQMLSICLHSNRERLNIMLDAVVTSRPCDDTSLLSSTPLLPLSVLCTVTWAIPSPWMGLYHAVTRLTEQSTSHITRRSTNPFRAAKIPFTMFSFNSVPLFTSSRYIIARSLDFPGT